MKNTLGLMTFLVVFLGCTTVPRELSKSEILENTVFSDNGMVTFQNNDYMIMGILVDNFQEALDIWDTPGSTPLFSQITKFKRNELMSLFLIYSTKKNKINMTYNLKILKPDGTYNEFNGLEIARTNTSNESLNLANSLPKITFNETHPFGTYQFHVTVFDNRRFVANLILEFNLLE
jgi:hypothetical protein